MYDQIREDTLFIMLYAVVTATAMLASCYLLFRRANAIAPDITPPVRLRRWTAVFFALLVVNHIWYLPIFFISSSEDIMMIDLTGGLFDCMTLFPVAIIVLLAMLQDRKRPLWPAVVMMAPIVVVGAWCVATRSYALQPMIYVYCLSMYVGIIIYMIRASRQYGRWLRDNFADLEHKEVWQSLIMLAIIMLVFVIYMLTSEGPVYQYAMQMIILILVCYFLWRVETLSDLSIPLAPAESEADEGLSSPKDLPQTNRDRPALVALPAKNIGALLQQHCIDTQLYLQHDLNLLQLAKVIGTNRLYLSQYFSAQGITYNTYINNLRIHHFMSLYCEAVAANRPYSAQQLASESGYRSYSTFRHAFKLQMGQNVREWMCDAAQKWQN